MNWQNCIKIGLLLSIASLCLFESVLNNQSGAFRVLEGALLQTQWALLICLIIWCGTFLFLVFCFTDLPLIGLLLITIAAYCITVTESQSAADTITLLAGVTLGKGTAFLLKNGTRKSEIGNFLVGMVALLVFSSWWHLKVAKYFYPGTRWTGLWDNPNDYGMLMSVGVLLAVGLLADGRWKMKDGKIRSRELEVWGQKLLLIVLIIAAFIMGTGLLFSYSRGAWAGTAVGLLYLAKIHGKFKWQLVLPGIFIVAAVVGFFWHSTANIDQWYLKRLDLSRPSAQHRVSAWRGALQMMRDHPLGVGWNKAVETYEKDYSPPEDGAAAFATNDYLMLGTQLGIPALICFVAYVALQLGVGRLKMGNLKWKIARNELPTSNSEPRIQIACRTAVLAMLVEFWFDGGLFKLATASVFWILLELGSERYEVRRSQSVTTGN